MTRGRKPRAGGIAVWTLSLPLPLVAEVELHLLDPFTRKVSYGARTELIQTLLREWLEKKDKE